MIRLLRRRGLLAATTGGLLVNSTPSRAQGGGAMTRIDFENAAAGSLPAGITVALTGSGGPVKWAILEDPTAPAGAKVLAQTSTDKTDYRFPLAIFDAPIAANLDVSVKFKPVAGEVDRAAGIAVRLKDRDNYYVVRANALENNVRLYRMVGGRRSQVAGVSTKVPSGVWQELHLKVEANRFEVFLDGKSLYTASDATFAGAGRVALWTKADSVTYFDDLRIV
ncbi:MAG: hypothetical protein ACHQK9_17825 [Reyranellales bacterium]